MIWLWTWLVFKKNKGKAVSTSCFPSPFRFLLFSWAELDEMDLFWWQVPIGTPMSQGQEQSWAPGWLPWGAGMICKARPRSALGHPSGGASASLTSSTPIQSRAYGNREFSPVLFEPRGNNSYLSLWKVVDFPTLGSWLLIKKQQGKETPHTWQCEIFKASTLHIFFKNLRRLAFYFCQGKV